MPHGTPAESDAWAKLSYFIPNDRTSPIAAWLSLLDHSLDVAACAAALIGYDPRTDARDAQCRSSSVLRRRLAALCGQIDLDPVTCARIVVLVAFHDLGKANHRFQDKAHSLSIPKGGHVAEALPLIQPPKAVRLFTETNPGDLLPLADFIGWFGELGLDALRAAITHHGGWPANPHHSFSAVHDAWADRDTRSPRSNLIALGAGIRSTQGLDLAWSTDQPSFPMTTPGIHGIAGLAMLADWIGSDATVFSYDGSAPEGTPRWPWSISKAQEHCAMIGMRGVVQTVPPEDRLHAVLPAGKSVLKASAAQQLILEANAPNGGSIAILEAATGDGKTEAALLHAARLAEAGMISGIYFALPTRIAAREVYQRVFAIAGRLFPGQRLPVICAIPGYAPPPIPAPSVEAAALTDPSARWDDELPAPRHSMAWAQEAPKRFLAGTISIGTIDQALLAGLKSRHGHLRSVCLLRSLLIIDEVHASTMNDPYMGGAVTRLLKRHREAGGHALLLSATLESTQREALLYPERSANDWQHFSRPDPDQAAGEPYPLLRLRDDRGDSSAVLKDSEANRTKHVSVTCRPWLSSPATTATAIFPAVRQGARVLVIRNTVSGALALLDALMQAGLQPEETLHLDGHAVVHHSRYAAEDRLRLDAAILNMLGKTTRHPGGCVVVATQTAEQSLDLDADWLVCDLAPMDVLLQRIGRLHRHLGRPSDGSLTGRPAGFADAQVCVLVPETEDLTPYLSRVAERHGLGPMNTDGDGVYADCCTLQATWDALSQTPQIHLPRDNRALVETCLHPTRLLELADHRGDAWQSHWRKRFGKTSQRYGLGIHNSCNWHDDYAASQPLPDERISTRLGELPVLIPFAAPVATPFGATIDRIAVPAWLLGGQRLAADASAATECLSAGFRFRVGDRWLRYDQRGINREGTD